MRRRPLEVTPSPANGAPRRPLRKAAATRDLPIIVVTGRGGANDWHTLKAIGADRFLVKPVDADALTNAIRTVTTWRSARVEGD